MGDMDTTYDSFECADCGEEIPIEDHHEQVIDAVVDHMKNAHDRFK